MDERPIALLHPDYTMLAVLDERARRECYTLVGLNGYQPEHPWAQPFELAGWIPLAPVPGSDTTGDGGDR